VATLKAIDGMVAQILSTFSDGHDPTAPRAPTAIVVSPVPRAGDPPAVGPQLPSSAMDQTDIDKLLASFD
jgi:hypothetical protein